MPVLCEQLTSRPIPVRTQESEHFYDLPLDLENHPDLRAPILALEKMEVPPEQEKPLLITYLWMKDPNLPLVAEELNTSERDARRILNSTIEGSDEKWESTVTRFEEAVEETKRELNGIKPEKRKRIVLNSEIRPGARLGVKTLRLQGLSNPEIGRITGLTRRQVSMLIAELTASGEIPKRNPGRTHIPKKDSFSTS